jgi:DNA-binding NarL/FixJ family response regulator
MAATGDRLMSESALNCVLLADRHHGLTEGMRGLLETMFDAVLMVADEASLVEGVARVQPDVVIGDMSLTHSGRLGWVGELRRRWPQVKLVVIGVHDEDTVRAAVLAAGADAFVLKRHLATDLLPAVERVCAWTGEGAMPAHAPTHD